MSVPPCEEGSVLRQALRPQLTNLLSESVENPETSALSQRQRTETHQRRIEKSNTHQQGPVTSVPIPVSCNCVPLCISDIGQIHASSGTALTHTNLKREETPREKREKPAKATKDLVKVKRLTTRNLEIKCNCNDCIAFLQSASLIWRLLETKQGRGDLICLVQRSKITALLLQFQNSIFDY